MKLSDVMFVDTLRVLALFCTVQKVRRRPHPVLKNDGIDDFAASRATQRCHADLTGIALQSMSYSTTISPRHRPQWSSTGSTGLLSGLPFVSMDPFTAVGHRGDDLLSEEKLVFLSGRRRVESRLRPPPLISGQYCEHIESRCHVSAARTRRAHVPML